MNLEPDNHPTVILLVEDDESNALLIEKQLSRRLRGSLQFRRADRLSAALGEVARGDVSVVLLDLGLPDSQGLDSLVRMSAAATEVPIVVLTGTDDEALADRALQLGAQDYIVKGGVDGEGLARTIRHAMERMHSQRALAAEHRLLLSIMDNIPDQVYLKDSEGRFVSVNLATATFLGASSPDAVIGKTDFDFFPHDVAAVFQQEEQALLHHEQPCLNREASTTDADGRTRWEITNKVCVRNFAGHATGILGINRDITARKQAEEALRNHQDQLEELVAARTAALRRANESLQAYDKARADFVSNVSHEIKSPLASLSLALQNLLTGVVTPAQDQAYRAYLDRMQDICLRIQRTVDDILDMSRIDAGTLRLGLVKASFSTLVRRVVDLLQPQMTAQALQVVLAVPDGTGFVECDRQRIERVLLNVLGNAIKFTPEGGVIRITLRNEVFAPGCLVLDTEDNGVGIHPAHVSRIGERYFQGNQSATGTGLGLSISRDILALHGGSLSLTSPPPGKSKGTLVTIRLPAVAPPELLLIGTGAPCQTVAARLAPHGYRATVCGDGAEALTAMRRAAPYATILDLSTAAWDMVGVIAEIKGEPTLQDVRLIALTEADIPQEKREILATFAVRICKQPWRECDLMASLA